MMGTLLSGDRDTFAFISPEFTSLNHGDATAVSVDWVSSRAKFSVRSRRRGLVGVLIHHVHWISDSKTK